MIKYNDGKWYMNSWGNIYYVEVNPCGCCPTSLLVEHLKFNCKSATNRYSDVFGEGGFEGWLKDMKLVEL